MAENVPLLLSLLRKEFPTLELQWQEDRQLISVRLGDRCFALAERSIDGELVVHEVTRNVVHNYFLFQEIEARLMTEDARKHGGAYVVVNSPTARFMCETFDSAFRILEKDGYMAILSGVKEII